MGEFDVSNGIQESICNFFNFFGKLFVRNKLLDSYNCEIIINLVLGGNVISLEFYHLF